MTNPTAAMLVIGDEILSGRTRDANMYYLAGALTEIGIDLKEVRVVSDDKAEHKLSCLGKEKARQRDSHPAFTRCYVIMTQV